MEKLSNVYSLYPGQSARLLACLFHWILIIPQSTQYCHSDFKMKLNGSIIYSYSTLYFWIITCLRFIFLASYIRIGACLFVFTTASLACDTISGPEVFDKYVFKEWIREVMWLVKSHKVSGTTRIWIRDRFPPEPVSDLYPNSPSPFIYCLTSKCPSSVTFSLSCLWTQMYTVYKDSPIQGKQMKETAHLGLCPLPTLFVSLSSSSKKPLQTLHLSTCLPLLWPYWPFLNPCHKSSFNSPGLWHVHTY